MFFRLSKSKPVGQLHNQKGQSSAYYGTDDSGDYRVHVRAPKTRDFMTPYSVRNLPSFAVGLVCGTGFSFLKADVNTLESDQKFLGSKSG